MKLFTNKKVWSKIIVILIFLLLFQFVSVNYTFATDDDVVLEVGGKLLSPILSLLVGLGDAVVDIMHKAIMGVDSAILKADLGSSIWEIIGNAFVWIIAAAVAVGLFVLTGGIIGPLLVGIAVGVYGMSVVSDITADNGKMMSRSSNFIFRPKNS